MSLLHENLPIGTLLSAILQIVQSVQKLGGKGRAIVHGGDVEDAVLVGDAVHRAHDASGAGAEN